MADNRTNEKRPFEGERCIETEYLLTYEGVMEGFTAVEAIGKNWRRTLGVVSLAVGAVLLLPLFLSPYAMLGALLEIAVLYLLYKTWLLPKLSRRRVARSIAERRERYTIRLFESGIQVQEKEHRYNLSYKNLTVYDAANCFVFVAKGRMIVLPKAAWGERLEAATAWLKERLETRYQPVTGKFRRK